jgi:hypothetical protein
MEYNAGNFYDVLWQAHQKEKNATELQPLPNNFYKDMNEIIAKIDPQDHSNPKLKENSARLMNELIERRKQKILIYVAYKKHPPQSNLPEEEAFYTSLLEVTKTQNFIGGTKSATRLKVLNELPQISLPSGSQVGPLSKNQIIELNNREDIEYLTSNGVCESA